MPTKKLFPVLLLTLAGCASTSPSVPPVPVAKVQTEEVGYFQTEWTSYLQSFKAGLESLSKGATGSTQTR